MSNELTSRYATLGVCKKEIDEAISLIIRAYEDGGKLLLCGNGGSSADCDHIVGELMKSFKIKRELNEEKKREMKACCPDIDEHILDHLEGGLPAISLTAQTALNSAFSNDADPSLIYAQGVLGLGRVGDVLIAVSTSGNSKNVVAAAKTARALKMKVISLTGEGGGALGDLSDVLISVPEKETYRVQELHLPVYHYICAEVEKHFFG